MIMNANHQSLVDFEDLMNDDEPRPLFDSEDERIISASQQASSESLDRTIQEFDTALTQVTE